MKKEIASQLLEIGAVFLKPNDPFTWSSGLKSPIYCDNRLTLSYPYIRTEIAEGLAGLIKERYSDCEIVAGTATAGIPHATLVADQMNLPMCYVRSKPKEHGKGNQIEGAVKKGQKVVVVEDLISTGGSAIQAAEALKAAGCDVLGIVAIFTYELEKASKKLQEAGLSASTLSNYSSLIEVALEQRKITEAELDKLKKWQQNPGDESWIK